MQVHIFGWRQLLLVLSLFLYLSLAQESATCSAAIHLPPPYVDITIVGTTANKAYADDGCSWEERSVTYRINPTIGNEVTIKSCGPAVQNDIWVTVYSGSCSSPQCGVTQGLYSETSCAWDSSDVSFVAEEEEYWVSVVSWAEEGGQFSISINEGVHAIPPPDCDIAVSLFGPYSPSLTIYGDVEPLSSSSGGDVSVIVIAVLDSYDDDSDWVVVDGTGYMPKSESALTVSESLPLGSRLLSVMVTSAVVGTDTASTTVSDGAWQIQIGYVNAQVMTTYEAASSASRDLTYGGHATGLRLSYTIVSYSTLVGVTFQDTQGSQASFTGFLDTWDSPSTLDIAFADLDDYADMTSIRKIVINVVGLDLTMNVQELVVIGNVSLPPMSSYVLPCTGVMATTSITWYKLYPSRTFVTVSTCNAGSEIATDVSAYAGDCSDLACTYFSASECANGSTVTLYWNYENFYISVSGRDGATGAFEMTVFESWYFEGDSSGWVDDDDFAPPVLTSISHFSPLSPGFWSNSPSIAAPIFSPISADSSYGWEPPADSGPGSACSSAIAATYGQSEVWTNTGLVYENMCGLYSRSGSRWFVFSPTNSDRVKMDVCTSNFDTVIAVVDNCNSLSCLASNDDSCGNNASSVTMDVTAGKDYYIIVGGYSSNSGSFRLNISSA